MYTGRLRKDEITLCFAGMGHNHSTHSYIVKRDPPPRCDHCQCILTTGRILVEERKEIFYLTTHSTHFITVIWRRTYG